MTGGVTGFGVVNTAQECAESGDVWDGIACGIDILTTVIGSAFDVRALFRSGGSAKAMGQYGEGQREPFQALADSTNMNNNKLSPGPPPDASFRIGPDSATGKELHIVNTRDPDLGILDLHSYLKNLKEEAVAVVRYLDFSGVPDHPLKTGNGTEFFVPKTPREASDLFLRGQATDYGGFDAIKRIVFITREPGGGYTLEGVRDVSKLPKSVLPPEPVVPPNAPTNPGTGDDD